MAQIWYLASYYGDRPKQVEVFGETPCFVDLGYCRAKKRAKWWKFCKTRAEAMKQIIDWSAGHAEKNRQDASRTNLS